MQIIEVLFPLLWESEFAHGRSEASPNSEQIEHTVATQHVRNSVSVEQIQDRVSEGQERGQIIDRAITPRGPILREIKRFRQKEVNAR